MLVSTDEQERILFDLFLVVSLFEEHFSNYAKHQSHLIRSALFFLPRRSDFAPF